jgi:TP901 family phage tail tape measure protein
VADAQRTIDLIFNGVDKTGAATLAALSNAEKFSSSLQEITAPIANFTVGALKLEGALLTAGVAMTTFAVKAAGDFDASFREIATLLDKPVSNLGEFRQAVLDYAGSSTAPLEQVTLAIYNAISAGVPLAESITAVAEAEKLSVAGKADLNDTLRVLVSSLNAYGLGMDSAGRFSDALFTAVKLGQTTLPELANSLSQVTGAAAAVGVPFETVTAALATLTATGTPTAQAVTQINAVLTSLLKPSKEAADLASELGLSFGVQAVKAKGLEGVLADVTRVTGGNQEQMAKLFGSVEALKAVFPLTGGAATKFAEALAAMADKSGATETAFAKMAGTVEQGGQAISNAFTGMLIAIGTPLLDEFQGVAQAIAAIFKALGASVKEGGLGEVVAVIESLFADLQETITTVARNLPAALAAADFSGFTRGIEAVIGAFGTLFSGIELGTVDGLTRAIELAGTAFLGLSKFTAGVIESFKPLFDLLVKIGSQIDGVNPDFFEFAGNIGGAVTQFNLLLGGINDLVPALQVLVGLMVANQGLSLVGAVKLLGGLLPGFTLSLSAAGAAAAGVFAADSIIKVVGALLEWKAAQEKLSEAQQRGQFVQEQAGETLARFAETSGIVVDSIDEATRLVDEGVVVWSSAANGWVKAGDALAGAADAAGDVADPFGEANRAMLAAAEAAETAAAGTSVLAGSQKELLRLVPGIVPIIDEATGKIVGYEQGLVSAADAGAKLGQSLDKAAPALTSSSDVMAVLGKKTNLTNDQLIALAKNTKDAEVELEKLASNERIKAMEFTATINVAQIEADTQRIEAAFESINVTIGSTGDVISSVIGALAGLDPQTQNFDVIERQLDLENARREEAMDLQRKLTEAQIEAIRAQTDSLIKGDALIKVDGAGLQPHLEAFMWEILKSIQVRVNDQGLALLLGV